jgi:transcriptional regulator with XRE-family HTH domain
MSPPARSLSRPRRRTADKLRGGRDSLRTVGDRLQFLRDSAGLSQEQVGSQIGVSRAAYAQWELGLTQPSLAKLEALADLLKVPAAYIAFGTYRDTPNGEADTAWVDEFDQDLARPVPFARWGIPKAYLDQCGIDPEQARIINIRHDHAGSSLRAGDKAIVDLRVRRAASPGLYVYQSGRDLDVAFLSPVPSLGREPELAIQVGEITHRVSPEQVSIEGRVVAAIARR